MKKLIFITIALLSAASVFAFGSKDKAQSSNTLTVGATPEPHATMLNLVKEDLAAQGITLNVMEFTDYVTPNEALQNGEIDANFFQHVPYLEEFNAQRGYSLVNAGGIHIEPMALYSKKISTLEGLTDGSNIAIPNDPTNEGRALLLLQSAGLITLRPDAGITATPLDIVDNYKNLQFTEVEAATLPRALDDVDAAIINGNYAIPAGLRVSTDSLFVEGADSPYVNIVAVKSGMETDSRIIALVNALRSKKVSDWIKTTYPDGEVVQAF